jgi:hypothetical protein
MQDRGPNPKETIEIIDQLVARGLIDERRFRAMHHLGGSIARFRHYCGETESFVAGGESTAADLLFSPHRTDNWLLCETHRCL